MECEYRQTFGKQTTANEQIDDEPDDSSAGTRDSPNGTEQQQDALAAAMEGSYIHISMLMKPDMNAITDQVDSVMLHPQRPFLHKHFQ